MKILIAEDEPVSRRLLCGLLKKWGHDVIETTDGAAAWEVLSGPETPPMAILDWMMPELNGPEVCRKVREATPRVLTFLLMLTARGEKADIVEALEAGADDFVCKPFDPSEFRARVQNGVRLVELQRALAERVRELEAALGQVHQLRGLLPICAWCKSVRDVRADQQYWQTLEEYLKAHSELQITHGICPSCTAKMRQQMKQTAPGPE